MQSKRIKFHDRIKNIRNREFIENTREGEIRWQMNVKWRRMFGSGDHSPSKGNVPL